MKNKGVILLLLMIITLTFVSAENVGTFKQNETMQITNYCAANNCTFITLNSLKQPNGTIIYPNATMTSNNDKVFNYTFTPNLIGEYTFVTCTDATLPVCDEDSFDVTYTGKEVYSGIHIILLLLSTGLFLGFIYINKRTDWKKWYKKILTKYENKNYVKITFSAIAYNILKNGVAIYYFLGFAILIIITDMILVYNIEALTGIITQVIWIYSFGIIFVAISLFGQLQEFIIAFIDDVKNIKWGIQKDE